MKGYGSNKNYGAEIVVHSSERTCSKVEYLVNSTPYQNIVANATSEQQSLFGTSSITAKDVVFQRCLICKPTSSADSQQRPGAASGTSVSSDNSATRSADRFSGVWAGDSRNSFGINRSMRIAIANTPDGAVSFKEYVVNGESLPVSGQVDGNIIHYSISGACSGTLTLNADGTMDDECRWMMFSQSGRLQRQ
ncbi:MAG TPA: hypothetical protein VF534_06915 [Paraburkholderia sp.]